MIGQIRSSNQIEDKCLDAKNQVQEFLGPECGMVTETILVCK